MSTDSDHGPRSADSIVMTALSQVEHPFFVVSAVIEEHLAEVYHRLDQRHEGAAFTVEDAVVVIDQMLLDHASAPLTTPHARPTAPMPRPAPRSRLFPVPGSPAKDFPAPQREAANGPQPVAPVTLDLRGMREGVALLRAEMILRQWRGQQTPPQDALTALAGLVDDALT